MSEYDQVLHEDETTVCILQNLLHKCVWHIFVFFLSTKKCALEFTE